MQLLVTFTVHSLLSFVGWAYGALRYHTARPIRQSLLQRGRVITLGVPNFRGASSSLDRFFVVLASAIDLRGPEVGLGL